MSKKEILELVFRIGMENYDLIVREVRSGETPLSDKTIQEILSLAEDLGPGSEDLSSRVDAIVYGGS
ncbi:hypothetical protein EU538_13200 [Candidatus Thorarchaeota archaeon]|nr:MAG: hypothetical protein EU538_13200 [Candidatus Thorarchaeota archaeon]